MKYQLLSWLRRILPKTGETFTGGTSFVTKAPPVSKSIDSTHNCDNKISKMEKKQVRQKVDT